MLHHALNNHRLPCHQFGNRSHPRLVFIAQREVQQQIAQMLNAQFGEFGRKAGANTSDQGRRRRSRNECSDRAIVAPRLSTNGRLRAPRNPVEPDAPDIKQQERAAQQPQTPASPHQRHSQRDLSHVAFLLATVLVGAAAPAAFYPDGPPPTCRTLAETRPGNDSNDIDEQQMFLFRAKGPVDAKTFVAHVFCEVEGVRSVDNVRPSAVPGARKCCARRDQQHRELDCLPLHAELPSGANVTIRWDSPTANTKQAVEILRFKGALWATGWR